MILIGIFALDNLSSIQRMMKPFFQKQSIKYAIVHDKESLDSLQETNVQLIFIPINEYCIQGIFFDIFICDNSPNTRDLPIGVSKAITSDTILIANSDTLIPKLSQPITAINYGLSNKATVTASSIIMQDDNLNFVYCLQRTLISLRHNLIEMQEIPVQIQMQNINIYHALAMITCALICDIDIMQNSHILINPKKGHS